MKKKKKLKKSRVADYLSPEKNPRYNTELDSFKEGFTDEELDFATEFEVLTDESDPLKMNETEIWDEQINHD